MAQWLWVLAALPEDLSSVPSSPSKQLTTACNSSSERDTTPSPASADNHTHSLHSHKSLKINKQRLKTWLSSKNVSCRGVGLYSQHTHQVPQNCMQLQFQRTGCPLLNSMGTIQTAYIIQTIEHVHTHTSNIKLEDTLGWCLSNIWEALNSMFRIAKY